MVEPQLRIIYSPRRAGKSEFLFELVYACYRSGQMSERQWQDHLDENELFAAWVKRRGELHQ